MNEKIGSANDDLAAKKLEALRAAEERRRAKEAREAEERKRAEEARDAKEKQRELMRLRKAPAIAPKGDGMTSDKPRLPSVEMPAVTASSAQWAAAKETQPPPALAPRRRLAVTSSAPKGDGITTDKPRLDSGDRSVPLQASAQPFRVVPGVMGLSAKKELAVTAQSSAPRAADFKTETRIPPDVAKLLSDPAAFKEAYLAAKERGEAWAVELAAESAEKGDQLDQALSALDDRADERANDGETRRAGAGSNRGQALLDKVKDEPWLLAAAAEIDADRARLQKITIEQASDVDFDAGAPEVMSADEKRRAEETDKNGVLKHPEIPTADDGSMKVPEPKDKYVTEYVKTNPIVEELRRSGYGNMWNPVFAYHLSAAASNLDAEQGQPPKGKGYLAMTEHGFAYCWNEKLTEEENRKVAEFSLRTGMLFERCDGMKDLGNSIDGALKQLDDFDPSKPGEIKILLDRTEHGYDKISISSDGKGNVDSHYYFRPDRGDHFRDQAEKYGVAVVATVVGVVALCLGQAQVAPAVVQAWQTAATYTAAAAATQSAYQSAKKGDWLGFALSLASIYASTTTSLIKDTSSRAYQIAQTVGDTATAVRGIQATLKGIEDGDIAAALGGVANAASAVASIAGTFGSGDVAGDFKRIADYAAKYGKAAAFGAEGVRALENGDYLTAFACAVQTVTAATGDKDDPAVQRRLAAAAAIKQASKAIKDGDWAGVIEHVLDVVKSYGDPKDPNLYVSAGIAITGIVSELRASNPLGAAKLAATFLEDLKTHRDAVAAERAAEGDPVKATYLDRVLADIDAQMTRLGGVDKVFGQAERLQTALQKRDPEAILQAATELAGNLTRDGRLEAAARLMREAQHAIDVIKRGGSFTDFLEAGRRLGQAICDVTDVVNGNFGDTKTRLAQSRAAIAAEKAQLSALRSSGEISQQTFEKASALLEQATQAADDAEHALQEGRSSRADQLLDGIDPLVQAAAKAAELRECHVDEKTMLELSLAASQIGDLERLLAKERDACAINGPAYAKAQELLAGAKHEYEQGSIAANDGNTAEARRHLDDLNGLLTELDEVLQGDVVTAPDLKLLRDLSRQKTVELPYFQSLVDRLKDAPETISLTGTGRTFKAELALRVQAYEQALDEASRAVIADPEQADAQRAKVMEARNEIYDLLSIANSEPKLLDRTKQSYQPARGQLFIDGISASDVKQGGLGDCFFMAALASVAQSDPQVIRDAIIPNEIGPDTEFVSVRLYDDQNKPVYVPVSLSLVQGYGTSTTARELWPAIMEKAFAQYVGGYPVLDEGGSEVYALQLLTGRRTPVSLTASLTGDQAYPLISTALARGEPVDTGSNPFKVPLPGSPKNTTFWDPATGIVGNHAYSIVDIYQSGGVTYVTLRNPWGDNPPPNQGTATIDLTWAQFQKDFFQFSIARSSPP